MFRFSHRLGPALAIIAAIAPLSAPASAEIQKMMTACPGQKLCAWLHTELAPPKGWVEDKDDGESNFVTMLVPDKKELGAADPLIYVQASLHRDPQTLDENIQMSQDVWRKSEPKVKITALGTAPRAGGKDPFKVFLYENPTRPRQAFEKIAFAFDKQANGDVYTFIVVDTAASRKAIDESDEAYQAVLAGL